MGSISTVKAEQVYDCMQSAAYNLVTGKFDNVYFTDVQQDDTTLPSKYAIIKQFNTSLEPKTVSGGVRQQQATLIAELNYPKGEVSQCRIIATEFTHFFSGATFDHDIVIDSVTSNGYDNPSGVKFVVVIDFNYIVRL